MGNNTHGHLLARNTDHAPYISYSPRVQSMIAHDVNPLVTTEVFTMETPVQNKRIFGAGGEAIGPLKLSVACSPNRGSIFGPGRTHLSRCLRPKVTTSTKGQPGALLGFSVSLVRSCSFEPTPSTLYIA